MTIEEFKALVALTITDKTADYSISPNDVGGRFDDLADLIPTASSVSVPVGTIIMYAPENTSEFDLSGLGIAGTNVEGWAICNGNSGTYNSVAYTTPDLKGRFVVGYDPSDTDYDTIGETGGQKDVTELLAHTHFTLADQSVSGGGSVTNTTQMVRELTSSGDLSYTAIATSTAATVAKTSSVGVATPDNRPPYYTVLYIKKIA